MRKAFNFYRSYYDVAKELSEKDRAKFLWAIMQKQFEGIDADLEGMAKFAYMSQKHSIDSQVTGYETKTKEKLTPTEGGCQGGTKGGAKGGSVQEKGEEKGEVEEPKVDVEAFLSWFNKMHLKYRGKVTKFKKIAPTDINNLTKLKQLNFEPHDWEKAFIAMTKSEWVIKNKYYTPEHYLRNENFQKYLNQYEPEPNQEFKFAWQ